MSFVIDVAPDCRPSSPTRPTSSRSPQSRVEAAKYGVPGSTVTVRPPSRATARWSSASSTRSGLPGRGGGRLFELFYRSPRHGHDGQRGRHRPVRVRAAHHRHGWPDLGVAAAGGRRRVRFLPARARRRVEAEDPPRPRARRTARVVSASSRAGPRRRSPGRPTRIEGRSSRDRLGVDRREARTAVPPRCAGAASMWSPSESDPRSSGASSRRRASDHIEAGQHVTGASHGARARKSGRPAVISLLRRGRSTLWLHVLPRTTVTTKSRSRDT